MNQRPFGYEPNELPGCSTPRHNENTRLAKLALLIILSQIGDLVNSEVRKILSGAIFAYIVKITTTFFTSVKYKNYATKLSAYAWLFCRTC